MTIQGKGGEKVVFKGVRKVMPNFMILVVIIEKLIRKSVSLTILISRKTQNR
jgi:hypothetical protein